MAAAAVAMQPPALAKPALKVDPMMKLDYRPTKEWQRDTWLPLPGRSHETSYSQANEAVEQQAKPSPRGVPSTEDVSASTARASARGSGLAEAGRAALGLPLSLASPRSESKGGPPAGADVELLQPLSARDIYMVSNSPQRIGVAQLVGAVPGLKMGRPLSTYRKAYTDYTVLGSSEFTPTSKEFHAKRGEMKEVANMQVRMSTMMRKGKP
eukprot:TRINITY_DN83924_c0_g1_i1.p1 TRINITY_DN83924_c0_g1~~TRINITY_DN83924_c0_g1_i1.p1  ORF type:complete len:211 (-),score=54.50 TRINITY_DN83924_c0_g1_i1:106-738(-)